MERIFREHLISKIDDLLIKSSFEFKRASIKRPNPFKDSVIWQLKASNNLQIFITLQFVADRNFVIPLFQWSRLARFPEEASAKAACSAAQMAGTDFLLLEEGWLAPTEFHRMNAAFYLEAASMPIDKLRCHYATGLAKQQLRQMFGIEGDEWEKNESLQDWSIAPLISGMPLDEEDAHLAWGHQAYEIVGFVRAHYLPLAERLIRTVS